MQTLIVYDKAEDWPLEIPGVETVDAWRYLTQEDFSARRNVRVMNLCRSYKYQSTGYYVSLLAEARGHRPTPGITALQDLKSPSMVRVISDELETLIQKSLQPLLSNEFQLSVYFGRNMASRYDKLSRELFNLFRVPLLKFKFVRDKPDDQWQLRSVRALASEDIPDSHWNTVLAAAEKHFKGGTLTRSRKAQARFDLAILWDPTEGENSPSNDKALDKFAKAGESMGLRVERIEKGDYARLSEFDALFIRQTTAVNHYTYRFARRAANEGLIVMDDPESISRCSNKVYLAELLQRHKVPTPRTLVAHKDNVDEVARELGFPLVLKKPDSSFSRGVVKVQDHSELKSRLKEFFAESDLLVAQEFLATQFDWRIGILDRRPFFACKYFMAAKHWQIIRHDGPTKRDYGRFETMPVEVAPRKAVQLALKAANLVGDGLYGVDVKESNGEFYVIEINDNPNMDAGVEDQILREDLYRRVMEVFLRRIEAKKAGRVGA